MILGPLSYLSYLLVGEIQDLATAGFTVEGMRSAYQNSFIHSLANRVLPIFHLNEQEALAYVAGALSNLSKEVLRRAPAGLGSIAHAFATFLIMAFILFFLFKDGQTYVATILDHLPFSKRNKEHLSQQAKDVVVSTIYGGVAVALAQGIVGTVGYVAVGMSSPVLWGLATAIASFIPLVGSHIVWVPMCLYLLAAGYIAKAAILAAFGVFGIGVVDNVVRPLFLRGRARMSFLLTFLSVLGGIEAFGLIGVIVGPLIMALYISLVAILKESGGEGLYVTGDPSDVDASPPAEGTVGPHESRLP